MRNRCSTALILFFLLAQVANANGLPRRGALGVSFNPIAPDVLKKAALKPGVGATVGKVFPDMTGAKLGLLAGDILVSINGKEVGLAGPANPGVQTVSAAVRDLPAGSEIKLSILRDGKNLDLVGTLLEKPRDPGTGKFSVEYNDVDTAAGRMRTIISHPKSKGRHAGLLFIQGYSPISYDFNLDGTGLDGQVLTEFASDDLVMERVEKPGVGDSEGGPFQDVDFTAELDIYRQALKQLKAQPDVDPNKIVIFGHSMGGAFGPIVASENPVKGLIMYGIAARTWHEYLLDVTRYQDLLAGSSYSDVDDQVRKAARMYGMILDEEIAPDKVAKDHPDLKALVDETFPNGLFNGKNAKYWGQLEHTNFASYWAKLDSPVLVVHGASDFVSYALDHQLVADIVNKKHPGWGSFVTATNSDHLLDAWPTEAESLKNWPTGKYSPSFMNIVKPWLKKLLSG